MRQPLRRAAPRRGGGRHAAQRAAVHAGRSAVRRASAAVLHARARNCRRPARGSRRCSTTARASTAGCSPIAGMCGLPHRVLPRVRPSAAAGDPRRRRALHRRARGRRWSPASTAARRPTMRCRSTGSRTPSRGSHAAAEDARYGAAPRALADAMTAHPEMVSGEGRNDLHAHARRPRRLGDQGRRRGRAGDRRAQPGLGIAHQGRRRQRPRTCIRRRSRCSTSWDCSMRRSARRSRRGASHAIRNYRGSDDRAGEPRGDVGARGPDARSGPRPCPEVNFRRGGRSRAAGSSAAWQPAGAPEGSAILPPRCRAHPDRVWRRTTTMTQGRAADG